MTAINRILSALSFWLTCLVVLVSPWLFGAWEMWWFWPFAVCVFAVGVIYALRVILIKPADPTPNARAILVVFSFLPFLLYAFCRWMKADVFMDAERSFLLHLTPFILGLQAAFGLDRRQRNSLCGLLLANLCLLGLYGLLNHLLTHSRWVLWMPGYSTYTDEDRATGSYYCPDHFSGLMELVYGFCLALILSRDTRPRWRQFAVLVAVIALLGVVLSKSRGGGLTIVVMTAAALVWGFAQWPASVRWYLRASAFCVLTMLLLLLGLIARSYTERFASHFGLDETRGLTRNQVMAVVKRKIAESPRGQMYPAALRAWRFSPITGIGPGMHQNLWPHVAASPDGDRDRRIWPKYLNNRYYSYETHSDWLQLLEEYGLIGLALFLIPFFVVTGILIAGIRRETAACLAESWADTGKTHFAWILSGLLACVAMGFHSLGDFNLQIPATAWILAAIIGIGVSHAVARPQPTAEVTSTPGQEEKIEPRRHADTEDLEDEGE